MDLILIGVLEIILFTNVFPFSFANMILNMILKASAKKETLSKSFSL